MAEKTLSSSSAQALGAQLATAAAAIARGHAMQPFVVAGERDVAPLRFALISRTGEYWSYPYAYVGLVACLSPEIVSIHCNCGEVETIEIKGRGLDSVAVALSAQKLLAVTESDHADFCKEGTIVTNVTIVRAEKK